MVDLSPVVTERAETKASLIKCPLWFCIANIAWLFHSNSVWGSWCEAHFAWHVFFGSCGVSPLDLHQDAWGGKGPARCLGQWLREFLESALASLGIVCTIMFSPSRDDDLTLVVCDHLWRFLSFLLCLVSHSAQAKWDLNPFPARSKLLERLKRRGCLVSCCGLSYCIGALLLPVPWLGQAWLPGTTSACPSRLSTCATNTWHVLMAVSGSQEQAGI